MRPSTLNILNLVNNEKARFYRQQCQVLRTQNVSSTTLTPPGNPDLGDGSASSRSVGDYVRFYPRVLRQSLSNYDILHANYGLTAPMALAQPQLPVVLSLWGSDLFGEYGWLSKRCADYCDAVIVMSDEMAAELDTDCHVIPHGIDMEQFRPRPAAEARRELGWDEDARHVLFPYRPERPVKDFPRAESVVAAARERLDAPVELQTVHGVPHGEMSRYYNAADTMLLTSKSEGSPNSVKEALACNLPVVATDVGDVRQRLADVSPAHVGTDDEELVDGLVDVLDDPVRSNGRETVRELSLANMGEQIRAVYERVL